VYTLRAIFSGQLHWRKTTKRRRKTTKRRRRRKTMKE